MKKIEYKIDWGTLHLSNTLHTIPNTIKFKNDESIPLELTTKEWIQREIWKAKETIKNVEQKKLWLNKKITELNQIQKLNKLFDKHITQTDIIGIHTMWDTEGNHILDENFKRIKQMMLDKESELKKYIRQEKKDIRTKVAAIKKICFENVNYILKADGIKNHRKKTIYLLDKNDIKNISHHKKTIIHNVDNYHLIANIFN